jgi:hypothetical protein
VEGLCGAWKVKNNPSKTLYLKYCQTKRDLLELPRLVKKVMENQCWEERGMKHTHLDRWTCASGKWMILRHEWSPRYRIAHGWKIWVWICHQGTWELMKQKEQRRIFIFYFYFISFSFSLFLFSFFLLFYYFYFLLIIISFSFFIIFLLLLRTFAMQYLHSNCQRWCNDSSPMLEQCSSSNIK